MSKSSLKMVVIITLLFFSWSTLIAGTGFTQKDNDILLKKADELFKKGNYQKATDILVFFIKENGKNWSRDNETALAYFMLSNIYFKNDKNDKKVEILIKNVISLNKDYQSEGPDAQFNDFFKITKDKINKETLEKNITKKKLKKEAEHRRIIEKKGKKKKKKFPILLVAGGAVVIAIAIYLLTKKYNSGSDVLANEVYNSLEWADVPEGEFIMGDDSLGIYVKAHTVFLDSYKISKYEITFEQYDKFCEDTKRDKPSDANFGRANRPVINVDWKDANAFCEWLTKKTGKEVSLPTEAQWEKAARGTDQRKYPWGNSYPSPSLGNFDSSNVGVGTVPVGSYPLGVSPYGVYDMAGNVAEWCSDWYSDTSYSDSSKNNPEGPSSGKAKIERGGGWRQLVKFYQSAYRVAEFKNNIFYFLGFRVVTK